MKGLIHCSSKKVITAYTYNRDQNFCSSYGHISVSESGNEEQSVDSATSFVPFDTFNMKSLCFKFGNDTLALKLEVSFQFHFINWMNGYFNFKDLPFFSQEVFMSIIKLSKSK